MGASRVNLSKIRIRALFFGSDLSFNPPWHSVPSGVCGADKKPHAGSDSMKAINEIFKQITKYYNSQLGG